MTKVITLISDFLLTAIITSFILGIGLSCRILAPHFLLCSLAAISSFILLVCYKLHLPKSTLASLLATFFLLGLLHGSLSSQPPESDTHIYNLIQEKRETVVVGTLASTVSSDAENSQALIDLQSVRFSDKTDFQTASGFITLRMKNFWPAGLGPGMMLAIRADLQRPSGFNTPGCFDYPAHLARQDIWVTGYIRSPTFIHRIEHTPSLIRTLRFFPEYLRGQIALNIDKAVNPQLQGIYRALLIGDQTKVDDRTRDAFRDSGCTHILSISGLHFAIIGTLLFLLVYWLFRRSEWLILQYNVKKLAMLTCLLPLCFYALLAGTNAPVLRSLIMSCIAILALCTDRRKSIPTILAFAALLILLANPQSLFTISFQLSFAAIASIAVVSPGLSLLLADDDQTRRRSLLVRLQKWFLTALAVSVAATLGTAPLLLMNFNQISLVGPLANLVVEPLICLWSLPLALLSCLAMPISSGAAAFFLQLGAPGLELSLKSMELFNALPGSSLWLATPHPLLVLAYYAMLTYLAWSLYRKKRFSFPAASIFFIVLFLFIVTPAELTKRLKKDLTVTFLDVGQGNATLLEYPGGYRLLIDGGGSFSSARQVGETVIAPFLWRKGITSLDQIIITHPDADHYNGIPFILEHFTPALLWTNTLTGHDRPYEECIDKAVQKGVRVILPKDGMSLPIHNQAGISCLVNLGKEKEMGHRVEKERSNDEGLIVQGSYKDFSALFPGDISRAAEEKLIQKMSGLGSTILLAPHHGSKTSNSPGFLSAVQPRYLIVSAGGSRSMYFPHPGLEEQCKLHNITMLSTARNGTIEVRTDGERFNLTRYHRSAAGALPSRLISESVAEGVIAQPNPPAAR